MNTARFHADDCQPLRDAVARGEVRMEARVRGQYPGTPLGKGRLPGLRTIGYWDAVGPQSWGLPMHRNEGIEICYLLHGQKMFNATPSGHLTRIRLAHGARMLRDQPDLTVTEIAFAVGFKSSQHFATRFRKQFGVPPGTFRGRREPASQLPACWARKTRLPFLLAGCPRDPRMQG